MAKSSTHRVGRRPGPITFQGKSVYNTFGMQPALVKLLKAAEQRTGRSSSEILHLIAYTRVRVQDVTLKMFEDYAA